ncbi:MULTISPECIES: XrtB/PEP-CTERM-associated transcriptional regulator EpsA [Methylovorus]|jgi:transcriptional regulator EpsA|uniref:Transcription regulator like protein EpsA n=1 Tax=Methylobacillus sp. (strain 12S) TaxID=94001 RepID=Q8GID0_METS1|nr:MULTISPECIES: XrtB/PEP-CTERM-associated transcriptional regulator EpsA [Methylovorus]ADQ84996.1 transcriptional regulator, LuxR family [Methylovorus sp. MP688]KAF0843602.1 LuxR family transcriptional regulator [Methylovorus glucosotrophus]BAC41336.1 transcription regulator like protein EpsA [Methylobacillus sp. 12S]
MFITKELTDIEKAQLIDLMHESLRIRSHFEFFLWMQGKLQQFLPHEIMITAWGDFSMGVIYFNIVSPLPGVRTEKISSGDLNPLLKRLFNYWLSHTKAPFTLSAENGVFQDCDVLPAEVNSHLKNMKSALVHGIKDFRGRHDCLYILLNSTPTMPNTSRYMLESLLPYIDSALRQLEHLPVQHPADKEASEDLHEEENEALEQLSSREIEIMEWVRNGKTNQEIGMILDISSFTVKNHLQRIFKKLDVLNRAQAVSKFKQTPRAS